MCDNSVYIVGAARTPVARFNGALSKVSAVDLGTVVIKEVLKRASVDPADVDEVIMGQIFTGGQGQNPSRQAAIKAGIPVSVPAYTINMLCGGGMKATALGFQSIRCGDSNIIVCGAQESLSTAPHSVQLRQGTKMGHLTLIDNLVSDGLIDAMYNIQMDETAENLSKKYNLSRHEQDVWSLRSHRLAAKAQECGYFVKEIVPVETEDRKKNKIIVDKDECIRYDTCMEKLEKLSPIVFENGTVTAGNTSQLSDAASAVVLMSGSELKKRGAKPLAKIIAWAQVGVCPKIMGYAVIPAFEAVLSKTGWKREDVDLYELNDSFAAQGLTVDKLLILDASKVNINGSSIALGHPFSASATRILITLLYSLERTGGKRGIACLCIGGGMGIAMAVERM